MKRRKPGNSSSVGHNRNSLSCISGRGPSGFLYPSTRSYVIEMMVGLLSSRSPKRRKGVCSGRRDYISVKSYQGGGITAVRDSTHPLETSVDLALLNTMVVETNKSHGAESIVTCRGNPLAVASRATKKGFEINGRDTWMHMNKS